MSALSSRRSWCVFLPAWTVGLCRQFLRSHQVPAEVILATTGIFFISTLCNPVIYLIRKREFRAGVKNTFRWMGVQRRSLNDTSNNQICMNNITVRGNIGTGASTARLVAPQAAKRQDERTGRTVVSSRRNRLSPIQEISE